MLNNYINSYKDEIVEKTCDLINIPSVSIESDNEKAPFGEDAEAALEYTLELGKKLGFRTKNIDGYCGYIEFGSGEKLVGIIGHLDVVPSGDGWNTDPFKAEVKDGKIYGRGAIDDKGPVISALYAMKAIKDNLNVSARVRLILGLNEEKSWKCIEHYKEVEEWPNIGFSPDANFPCIYAEKGICTVYISDEIKKYEKLPLRIVSIDCKNNAINVVPKYCKITLEFNEKVINSELLKKFIDEEKFSKNILVKFDGNKVKIESNGIQAHAAHPDLGVNAISQAIVLIQNVYEKLNLKCNILEFFKTKIGTEFDGNSLEISKNDESGDLTLNVGNFSLDKEKICLGMNLRIPVKTKIDDITKKISEITKKYDLTTIVEEKKDPLYIDKNDELVKKLCKIFNENCNTNYEPIAIGGGTYARAFKNFISFGMNFPEDIDMCHQANEFVEIEKQILSTKIYAEAIWELAK